MWRELWFMCNRDGLWAAGKRQEVQRKRQFKARCDLPPLQRQKDGLCSNVAFCIYLEVWHNFWNQLWWSLTLNLLGECQRNAEAFASKNVRIICLYLITVTLHFLLSHLGSARHNIHDSLFALLQALCLPVPTSGSFCPYIHCPSSGYVQTISAWQNN